MELLTSQKSSFSVLPELKGLCTIIITLIVYLLKEMIFFLTVIHLKVIVLSFFDCVLGIYLQQERK